MSSTHVGAEIASQPQAWRQAAALAHERMTDLPQRGERVAVVGCGTSWFIAQAYAARREEIGHGETDAFAGSEFPAGRLYDRVVAISRSGTTTEILELLRTLRGRLRTVAIVGDAASPCALAADDAVAMPFADEKSVVQTRFATSALSLLRAGLGEDVEPLAEAAESAVTWAVPPGHLERQQFTFLGRGFAVGLANEAALKMREASLAWAESYPAMDYRHGPISVSDGSSIVYLVGEGALDLVEDVERTGALAVPLREDPQVALVRLQRLAVANAVHKGLDPDAPRHLTRSVILDARIA
ncbi:MULTISPECIES: SIS domain-containing protein [unclassified Isoptericola]|uniref:SIS domain-containing protein n=1 Tax=unclassified Isoptericola TaxID=2623355 RepID=UPI002712716A|nr:MULTISPECIES: SIS domain-containing protein [unclassified Isoptericola]MDO8145634.1 SIS domain-containing protein [Isoptericola sp. 178]MDO8149170.1 SIS domain-containing protein [Isoptericola sp. b515]